MHLSTFVKAVALLSSLSLVAAEAEDLEVSRESVSSNRATTGMLTKLGSHFPGSGVPLVPVNSSLSHGGVGTLENTDKFAAGTRMGIALFEQHLSKKFGKFLRRCIKYAYLKRQEYC